MDGKARAGRTLLAVACKGLKSSSNALKEGSPKLSLKALMAYPDVKLVVVFVCCCSREAGPHKLRVWA
jgi:hypothetical protein